MASNTTTHILSRIIWNKEKGDFEPFTFIVTFDPNKLPLSLFDKVAKSKLGRGIDAGGAVVITRAKK